MEIAIEHNDFRGMGLAVRTAGLFRGPRLLQASRELQGQRNQYKVRDRKGTERRISLKFNIFDPVPALQVDNEAPQSLARPIRWYEYLWTGWPLVLMVGGGAIGGFLGGFAVWSNLHLFRSDRGTSAKYFLTAAVSWGAVIAFAIIATALQTALGIDQD